VYVALEINTLADEFCYECNFTSWVNQFLINPGHGSLMLMGANFTLLVSMVFFKVRLIGDFCGRVERRIACRNCDFVLLIQHSMQNLLWILLMAQFNLVSQFEILFKDVVQVFERACIAVGSDDFPLEMCCGQQRIDAVGPGPDVQHFWNFAICSGQLGEIVEMMQIVNATRNSRAEIVRRKRPTFDAVVMLEQALVQAKHCFWIGKIDQDAAIVFFLPKMLSEGWIRSYERLECIRLAVQVFCMKPIFVWR